MSDISSISCGGNGSVGPVNRLSAPAAAHLNGTHAGPNRMVEVPPGADRLAPTDRVELSHVARFLDQLRSMPDVRFERVARVRQEIAHGAYEDEAKLEAAIDRLALEELL